MIKYAAENSLEEVLENVTFEAEVLEVRRSSLVVPCPPNRKREIIEIPEDQMDFGFTGLKLKKVQTTPYPRTVEPGTSELKAKTFRKSETITKAVSKPASTASITGRSASSTTGSEKVVCLLAQLSYDLDTIDLYSITHLDSVDIFCRVTFDNFIEIF